VDDRFYGEYARIQDQHWWFRGRRRVISAVLSRWLPAASRRDLRILDIGCGTGTNLAELSRFGSVEGVDAEAFAVEHCRRAGWRVAQVTGEDLPFPDESFDVVTLLDVIEHVDDDVALLAEARRVLVPGGVALVSVPAYMWMWGAQDEISHHRRRYTAGRLRESLHAAGLRTKRTTYFNTLLFAPIALVRVMRRFRGGSKGEAVSDFEMNAPGLVNSLLGWAFGLEAPMLRRLSFPFGVSALGVAVRE
jgi:SAM-dependent methyltransferase